MTARRYGQYCGLARALELIGERWSMLVVRDLMLGPKRYTDLRRGLPRIPESILSARLNDLEQGGVIRRRVLPQLDAAVVYELTEYGGELDQILLRLGLWGARSLGEPAADDVMTVDSAILSLYTTFRPEAAKGVRVLFQVHYGDLVVHALVDDGGLKVAEGPHPDADLVIRPRRAMLRLLKGELDAVEAVESGQVVIQGPAEYLSLFTELFRIGSSPEPLTGLAVH